MESSINNHTSAAVARMDSDGQESLAFAKSLLDCARALFLDVFTQYQAIFSNSNLPSTTALAEDYSPPASILFSFMTHLSEEFLCDFTKSIDDIFDIGSLSNLLTQAMHFGVAISRKGIDIRYQLTAIIRDRVIKVVAEHSERATVNFMTEFEQNGFKTMISARSSKQQHTKTNFSVEGADKRSPDALLDYPPLAALLNSNLQLFNMFRIIPVVELSFELGKIFMRNTLRIIEAFSNYYRQNIAMNSSTTTANSEQERTDQERAFRELFRAFADLYIPFICRFMNDGLHLPNHQTISKELQLATQAIII
jgi:hypothetical protein